MPEELKDSGIVTAMSVVGFVFGLIGMLGSFIPCIGSFAFLISIPALIISGIALLIAKSQKAKSTFAIVALTICLIGTVISGIQYFGIIYTAEKANKKMEDILGNNSLSSSQSIGNPIKKNINSKYSIDDFLNTINTFGNSNQIKDFSFDNKVILEGDISSNGELVAALVRENENGLEDNCLIIEPLVPHQETIKIDLKGEAYFGAYLEITPNSREILIITPSTITIFEASTGNILKEFNINTSVLPPKTTAPPFFCISASGKVLAISDQNYIDFVSLETGEMIKTIVSQYNIHAVCFSKNEDIIASASIISQGFSRAIGIQLFNYETGNLLTKFTVKTSNIEDPSIIFSNDQNYLYISSCVWSNGRNLNFDIIDIETETKLTSWTHNKFPAKVKMDNTGLPYFSYFFTNGIKKTTISYDSLDYFNLSLLTADLNIPVKQEIETSEEYDTRIKINSNKLKRLQKESKGYLSKRNIKARFPVRLGEYSADNKVFHITFGKERFLLKATKEMAMKLVKVRDNKYLIGLNLMFCDIEITKGNQIELKNLALVTADAQIYSDINWLR